MVFFFWGKKKNFESFDDNIIDAYMNIEPVKYQLKQSSNDKYHFGFKAQHIDKVFSDYGDIYNESFDICTSRPNPISGLAGFM